MRKWIEIALLHLAAWILSRNVPRARYISRRDNNRLFEFEHQVRAILKRLKNDYQNRNDD